MEGVRLWTLGFGRDRECPTNTIIPHLVWGILPGTERGTYHCRSIERVDVGYYSAMPNLQGYLPD